MKTSPLSIQNLAFKANPIEKKAIQIADILLENRRPFKGELFTKNDYLYLQNKIVKTILPFVKKEESFPTVIVGFSMKCPSPKKTISQNADRAEFEALKHLNNITEKIKQIYIPGTQLKIFADGRAFAKTIVGASDSAVTKYVEQLRNFLKKIKSKNVEIIALEDIYKTQNNDFDKIRNSLFTDFPVNKEEMAQTIAQDPFLKTYKTFIRDFYAKDIRAIIPGTSEKKSKLMGEKVAFGVICAAESLSQCVFSLYKNAMVRTSVHGKPVNDIQNKIGMYLNALHLNCPMPWHGAALKISKFEESEKFIYEKKFLIEKAKGILINDKDGKGAYYNLPDNFKYDINLSFKENLKANIK